MFSTVGGKGFLPKKGLYVLNAQAEKAKIEDHTSFRKGKDITPTLFINTPTDEFKKPGTPNVVVHQ